MNLKKLVIFYAFIHTNIFATTNVVFSNNTLDNYLINSQILETKTNLISERDYKTTNNILIKPYVSNMTALKFNSNVNIKKGHEYHFNVSVQNTNYPNQNLNFYITSKGLFTGSQIIETKVSLPSGEMIELNPKQRSAFVVPNWNNVIFHFVPYEKSENTVWWPSYVLMIDQNNEDSFDYSAVNTFKAISYNVQLFPFYMDVTTPANNKSDRARSIPKLLGNNYDYVSLNELFDRDLRNQIIRTMKVNYPYYVNVAGMQGANILSSGVVTFSKWPILAVKQLVYQNCVVYECLANKGVTYVKIQKTVNGVTEIYNVFSTHMQDTNDTAENRAYYQPRAKQIRELHDFILDQNIPESEVVLVAGDLNINKYSQIFDDYHAPYNQTEYQYLLHTLNASDPAQTGLQYSFDGTLNTMLELISTEQSHLDYILYLNDHKLPTYAVNHIKPLRDTSNTRMFPIYDTSDHFPVIGEFVFSET